MIDVTRQNPGLPDDPDPACATSQGRQWTNSLSVDIYPTRADFALFQQGLDHHCVTCMLADGQVTQTRNHQTLHSTLRRKSMLIRPAYQDASWSGYRPAHMRLRIPGRLLDAAWVELGTKPSRPVELITVFHEDDEFVSRIANMVGSELEQPEHTGQSLVMESITLMITAHLVRRYCAFDARSEVRVSGLSARHMTLVRDYVAEHLGSAITLQLLAAICEMSVFHFARAFRVSSGMTPKQFVEEARMEQAKVLLRSRHKQVGHVAAQLGYADGSHFARRFAIHAQCSPSEYARTVRSGKLLMHGSGVLPVARTSKGGTHPEHDEVSFGSDDD